MADSAQSSIRPVDEYRGDYQVNQRKTGFSPYRSAIVNKAASILAKRKDSRSSWKWIMINTLFAAMFYVGMYVIMLWLQSIMMNMAAVRAILLFLKVICARESVCERARSRQNWPYSSLCF